jgi:hypothetical protein
MVSTGSAVSRAGPETPCTDWAGPYCLRNELPCPPSPTSRAAKPSAFTSPIDATARALNRCTALRRINRFFADSPCCYVPGVASTFLMLSGHQRPHYRGHPKTQGSQRYSDAERVVAWITEACRERFDQSSQTRIGQFTPARIARPRPRHELKCYPTLPVMGG